MYWWIFLIAAIVLLLSVYLFCCISNYRRNRKFFLPDGLILNQSSGDTAKMRYGFFRTSYNGCGWIALYNALYLMGKKPRAEKIIRELEWTAVLLFGVFGTVPFGIANYLRIRGYRVKITYNTKKYDIAAKNNAVSIVWYFHKRGAHFVTLKWDGVNFLGYNTYSDSTSADSWGKSISENLKRRKKHPVMLISISESKVTNAEKGTGI